MILQPRPQIHLQKIWNFLHLRRDFYLGHGLFHYNLQLFRPFPVVLFFILFSLLAGLWIKYFLSFALALIILLCGQYFITKKKVHSLMVKRIFRSTAPAMAQEQTIFTVEYHIANPSSFALKQLLVIDYFSGSDQPLIPLAISELPSRSKMIFQRKLVLNQGMGEKFFGPLFYQIEDSLGIFKFTIKYPQQDKLLVLPKIELLPDKVVVPDPQTFAAGAYNLEGNGSSTNFIGVMEYLPGMPIKKINWKLSLKENKLILNQFEKDAFASLYLFLDFRKNFRFGHGQNSTWEYMKDICLSLASSAIAQGNHVAVISQEIFLPLATGPGHLEKIQTMICHGALSEKNDFPISLESLMLPNINVLYVAPFVQSPQLLDHLQQLASISLHSSVYLILIDPFPYLLTHDEHTNDKYTNQMLVTLQEISIKKLLPLILKHRHQRFHFDLIRLNKKNNYSYQFLNPIQWEE